MRRRRPLRVVGGKIDCVELGGAGSGTTQATFTVTRANGSLSGFQGGELRVDVHDSGMPGGTGDTIDLHGASGPCDFSGYFANQPLDEGNISVHQAS